MAKRTDLLKLVTSRRLKCDVQNYLQRIIRKKTKYWSISWDDFIRWKKKRKPFCTSINIMFSLLDSAVYDRDSEIITLTKMFSGLTSLCMILSEWRCSIAEPISSKNLTAKSFPCPVPWFFSRYALRFPPAMNSITIASWFWIEMHSSTFTILGCFASLKK